jgi:hypothetical protein
VSTPKLQKPISKVHRPAPTETTDAPPLRRELRVLEVDRDHAVATWANLMVIVWRGQTQPVAVLRAEKALEELMATYTDGVGLLQVAEPTAPPPDGASRAAVAKMLESGRGRITSSSLVYAGTGFYMAAARAFVTGLSLLTRAGFPHEVFATVPEAAEWHARLMPRADGRYATQQDIVDTTAELTSILDKRYSSRPKR